MFIHFDTIHERDRRTGDSMGGATLIKLVRQNDRGAAGAEVSAEGTRIEAPVCADGIWPGEGCPLPSRLGDLGSVVSSPSGVWAEPQPLAIIVHFTSYFLRSEAYKFIFQHHPRMSSAPV